MSSEQRQDPPGSPSEADPASAWGPMCPSCGGVLARVHRRWPERWLSLWLPLVRMRCVRPGCGWLGTLRARAPR